MGVSEETPLVILRLGQLGVYMFFSKKKKPTDLRFAKVVIQLDRYF